MEDELDLDLTPEEQNINRTEARIKDLSSKVREKASEAEAAKEAAQKAEEAREAAEKRAEFLENFSNVSAKYPDATEYKADIEAKVQAGYSLEDAAVAVLASQGKFTPQVEQVQQSQAAGGSAPTEIPVYADKPIGEMSREEMRNALIEADRNGELRKVLKY